MEELNSRIGEVERSKETQLAEMKTKFQAKKKVIFYGGLRFRNYIFAGIFNVHFHVD